MVRKSYKCMQNLAALEDLDAADQEAICWARGHLLNYMIVLTEGNEPEGIILHKSTSSTKVTHREL
eukprot:970176-Amphidinium_carterae.1